MTYSYHINENFLQTRILDLVPADTDVVLWGENHLQLLHRFFLYKNIPDLAQKGYALTLEMPDVSQKYLTSMIEKIGYRPYYFNTDHSDTARKLKERELPEPRDILFPVFAKNGRLITENQPIRQQYDALNDKKDKQAMTDLLRENSHNILSRFLSPSSVYKILRAAHHMKMPFYCTDVPVAFRDEIGPETLEKRNHHMTTHIATISAKQKKPLLHWGGMTHLYSAPLNNQAPEHSLQSLLQKRGLKTYTITAITGSNTIASYRKHGKILETIEPGLTKRNDWKTLEDNIYDSWQEICTDLHCFTDKAGKDVPDMYIAFPDSAEQWANHHASPRMLAKRTGDGRPDRSPVLEAAYLNNIWNTFKKPSSPKAKQSTLTQ